MSPAEQLTEAIKNKNVEEVKSLLEQDTNINYGMNAIFAAVTTNKDIVQLLLSHGADVNDEFIDFEESNDGDIIVRIYTPITFMLMGKLNKRDKIDILKLLLQAGANPDTTCTYKDANDTILASILFNANPEILFLLLIFGAELKNEDLAIIREKSDLQSCFTAFETVKAMPHLGKLIEANTKWDEEENAKAIASYINNEAEGQKLIKEFKTIKEKYGSNEQLSFVPEHLLDFIEHITIKFLKSRINQKTIADQLHRSKDDIQVTKKFTEGVQNIYENLSKIASEKIVSYFDNDTKKNVLLALNKKADEFLNKLKNVCQSPNTALASSQSKEIEPSAEHKRIDR